MLFRLFLVSARCGSGIGVRGSDFGFLASREVELVALRPVAPPPAARQIAEDARRVAKLDCVPFVLRVRFGRYIGGTGLVQDLSYASALEHLTASVVGCSREPLTRVE